MIGCKLDLALIRSDISDDKRYHMWDSYGFWILFIEIYFLKSGIWEFDWSWSEVIQVSLFVLFDFSNIRSKILNKNQEKFDIYFNNEEILHQHAKHEIFFEDLDPSKSSYEIQKSFPIFIWAYNADWYSVIWTIQ